MYCDFHPHELETMAKAVQQAEIEVRRYPILQVMVDNNPPFYCLNKFSKLPHNNLNARHTHSLLLDFYKIPC